MHRCIFSVVAIIFGCTIGKAQINTTSKLEKVSHTEPLFIDLVRDPGARAGEKEVNIGGNFISSSNHNEYGFFAECEFAPINRLGIEIETDFSFTKPTTSETVVSINKLEYLRLSTQYSFFVSPEIRTTMAIGYSQITEFTDFKNYGTDKILEGTIFNPFFFVAKRLGNQFHTLVHISPSIKYTLEDQSTEINCQLNTSFHYALPGTKHFVGLELNNEIHERKFAVTIHPQIKINLNKNLSIGFVTGLKISQNNKDFSSFFRVIYEL